jgi:hypothetical protein
MTAYNVEAYTAPVTDGNFDALRDVIDDIPGTILIEDPDEPLLVFPVDANSWKEAYALVDGLLRLAGIEPLKGRITLEDDDCCGVDDGSDWRRLATL